MRQSCQNIEPETRNKKVSPARGNVIPKGFSPIRARKDSARDPRRKLVSISLRRSPGPRQPLTRALRSPHIAAAAMLFRTVRRSPSQTRDPSTVPRKRKFYGKQGSPEESGNKVTLERPAPRIVAISRGNGIFSRPLLLYSAPSTCPRPCVCAWSTLAPALTALRRSSLPSSPSLTLTSSFSCSRGRGGGEPPEREQTRRFHFSVSWKWHDLESEKTKQHRWRPRVNGARRRKTAVPDRSASRGNRTPPSVSSREYYLLFRRNFLETTGRPRWKK